MPGWEQQLIDSVAEKVRAEIPSVSMPADVDIQSIVQTEVSIALGGLRLVDRPEFYRPATVGRKFGISTTSVWRWVKGGKLPQPIDLGDGTKGFDADAIDRLIASYKEKAVSNA